jgi:hypothetical protein
MERVFFDSKMQPARTQPRAAKIKKKPDGDR